LIWEPIDDDAYDSTITPSHILSFPNRDNEQRFTILKEIDITFNSSEMYPVNWVSSTIRQVENYASFNISKGEFTERIELPIQYAPVTTFPYETEAPTGDKRIQVYMKYYDPNSIETSGAINITLVSKVTYSDISTVAH